MPEMDTTIVHQEAISGEQPTLYQSHICCFGMLSADLDIPWILCCSINALNDWLKGLQDSIDKLRTLQMIAQQ